MTPDMVNGLFELLAAPFIATSAYRAFVEKKVRGVSLWHINYFLLWAFWNCYLYPSLGMWYSFAGGIVILLANLTYAWLVFYYRRREKCPPIS
jgi:hypothetical protein